MQRVEGISGWVQGCQALVETRRLDLFNIHARPPLLSKSPLPYLGWPMMDGYDPARHTHDIEQILENAAGAPGAA